MDAVIDKGARITVVADDTVVEMIGERREEKLQPLTTAALPYKI